MMGLIRAPLQRSRTIAHEPARPHAHDHAAMTADPSMAKRMERDMARRFWVALVLTIPIVVVTGHLPGVPMLVHPPVSNWLALALSTPVVFWCGWVFLTGSVRALRTRKLDMSVLIATGVLAAYLSSVYLTIIGYPTGYFEAAAMLVTFVLFGHWMEMKSRRGTSDALRALFDLVPPSARVIRNGHEQQLPTSDVVVGDALRVLPGVPVKAGAGETSLYRHGVELAVKGSYFELLQYLEELEKRSSVLLWGSVELQVEQYPEVRLRVVIHSLSRNASLLSI